MRRHACKPARVRHNNAPELKRFRLDFPECAPPYLGIAFADDLLNKTFGCSSRRGIQQLKAAGARQVFREVASGAKTDRAQLLGVLARLDAGDVLMVTRLDRLARSTRDLLNTLAAIASKGAGFPLLQPKRGAVNPHATFCGNRRRATASSDPVGAQQ
jgi:hypothetical protein